MQSGSALLAYVLSNNLMNTAPFANMHFSVLAISGCSLTYTVDNGDPQTGLLVHKAETVAATGVIPVASLLGATLIGMRIGMHAPLLRKDGSISKLSVIDISHPT